MNLKLYDLGSKTVVTSFEGHKANITAIAFQSESRWIFSASEDSTLRIWETKTGLMQRTYDAGSPINDAVIHPNQGEILTVDNNGLKVWDLSLNSCTLTHNDLNVPIRSVAIAPDGSFIILGDNTGVISLYKTGSTGSLSSLTLTKRIEGHEKYITRVLISPEARFFASTSADKTIRVYDAATLSVKVLEGHTRWVWDASFSADSAYLVSASSDHSARLWDLKTGEAIRHYNGHQKAVVCVDMHDVL